jgi:hypothetical protein
LREIFMNKLNLLSGAALAAALVLPIAADAASGPFAALAGSWSGGGHVAMADGSTEQLRCRASYTVDGAGNGLRLSLRCASQSANFELGSNVAYEGGRIAGTWSEATRNASGSISGSAGPGQIEATATGQNFSASLSLATKGNRQTVTIRSEGSDIAGVSLALNRN